MAQTALQHCPNCGKALAGEEQFCSQCGWNLAVDPNSPRAVPTEGKPPSSIHTYEDASISSDQIPETIRAFDEAVKQLITVEGLLAGLYFNAFTFGKISSGLSWQLIVYLAPIALIFVSLFSAIRVFFPSGYLSFDQQSTGSQRDMYADLNRHKIVWFRLASTFFVLGIAGVFFALMTYLLR